MSLATKHVTWAFLKFDMGHEESRYRTLSFHWALIQFTLVEFQRHLRLI